MKWVSPSQQVLCTLMQPLWYTAYSDNVSLFPKQTLWLLGCCFFPRVISCTCPGCYYPCFSPDVGHLLLAFRESNERFLVWFSPNVFYIVLVSTGLLGLFACSTLFCILHLSVFCAVTSFTTLQLHP